MLKGTEIHIVGKKCLPTPVPVTQLIPLRQPDYLFSLCSEIMHLVMTSTKYSFFRSLSYPLNRIINFPKARIKISVLYQDI